MDLPQRATGHPRQRFSACLALLGVAVAVLAACGGGGNGGGGGGGNPVPSITTISPNIATPGGAAFTLTVNGSNFISSSLVRWNASDRTTTFVSSTQLTASITASDIATAGTAQVTVFNPAPGGGTSNAATLNIRVVNDNFADAIAITSLPSTNTVDTRQATTETGDPTPSCGNSSRAKSVWYRFTPSSTASFTADTFNSNYDTILSVWTGSPGAFTQVGCNDDSPLNFQSQLSFTATSGVTYYFMITDFDGIGGSLVFNLAVGAPNPVPSISSISPSTTAPGGSAFTLTVDGLNFVSTSVVRWNGSDRTTTFVSSTRLTAAISAADIASQGTAQVTVFNPLPGGGTSNTLTFTIATFTITTTRLPDTTGSKSYNFTLTTIAGIAPITWSVVGSLPTTLTLDASTGRISGTVSAVGVDTTTSFTVQAADSSLPQRTDTQALSILVRAAGPGRNDTCTAGTTTGTTQISNGTLRASLSPYGDLDVYSFQGTAGQRVTIETFAQRLDLDSNPATQDSFADTVIELLGSTCSLLAFSDDIDLGVIVDSLIADFTLPSTGTFFIRVRDYRGDGRADLIYELRLSGAN